MPNLKSCNINPFRSTSYVIITYCSYNVSAPLKIRACCFLYTDQKHIHVLALRQTNTPHIYFIQYCTGIYNSIIQMTLISTYIRPIKHLTFLMGQQQVSVLVKKTEHLILLNITECRTSINGNIPNYCKPNTKHAAHNCLSRSHNLCLTSVSL